MQFRFVTKSSAVGEASYRSSGERCAPLARAAGFDNVSFDLMMWLLQQSLSDWLTSVDALIEVARTWRWSCIPTPCLEKTWPGWLSVGTDEDAAEMHVEALARLEERAAEQYEISTWRGWAGRRGTTSSTGKTASGSASAAARISTRAGVRWRNVPATMDYIQAIAAGAPVIAERRVLDTEERVEEALFTDFA